MPYRNSKLTLLLSDALGAKGSCAKTIMIVQVSPSSFSSSESIRTLRFGERCQSVKLGSIKQSSRREKSGEVVRLEGEVKGLMKEEERQRKAAEEAGKRCRKAEERACALEVELEKVRAKLREGDEGGGRKEKPTLKQLLAAQRELREGEEADGERMRGEEGEREKMEEGEGERISEATAQLHEPSSHKPQGESQGDCISASPNRMSISNLPHAWATSPSALAEERSLPVSQVEEADEEISLPVAQVTARRGGGVRRARADAENRSCNSAHHPYHLRAKSAHLAKTVPPTLPSTKMVPPTPTLPPTKIAPPTQPPTKIAPPTPTLPPTKTAPPTLPPSKIVTPKPKQSRVRAASERPLTSETPRRRLPEPSTISRWRC